MIWKITTYQVVDVGTNNQTLLASFKTMAHGNNVARLSVKEVVVRFMAPSKVQAPLTVMSSLSGSVDTVVVVRDMPGR